MDVWDNCLLEIKKSVTEEAFERWFKNTKPIFINENELFIDKDIAKYYYEANLYYEAFENEFNKQVKPILNTINLK